MPFVNKGVKRPQPAKYAPGGYKSSPLLGSSYSLSPYMSYIAATKPHPSYYGYRQMNSGLVGYSYPTSAGKAVYRSYGGYASQPKPRY